MKRIFVSLAVLAALVLALSPGASAKGTYTCTTIAFATTIDQNVVVPDGAGCALEAVTVNGNLTIGNNAGVDLNSTVNGNVSVGSNSGVDFRGATVNGNVSVGPGSTAGFDGPIVNGNYSAFSAHSLFLDFRVAKNVTITGGNYFFAAPGTIGMNLTCDGGATGGASVFGVLTVGGHNNGCNL